MITIPSEPTIITDAVTLPGDGLPGSIYRGSWVFDAYNSVNDDDTVDTLQMDFALPYQLSDDAIIETMVRLTEAYAPNGQTLLGFSVYEAELFDIQVPTSISLAGTIIPIPSEVCLPIVGCIPIAGQTIASGYQYRFWILSKDPQVAAYNTRSLTAGVILAIGLLIPVLLVSVIGFTAFITGKIKFGEIREATREVLDTPKRFVEGSTGSFAWPLAVLGVVIVAAGLIIPVALNASGDVRVPIPGGGTVGVGGTIGSGKR